jgi:acyl-CoA dehydrogenase
MPKGDDEHLPRLENAFLLVTEAAEVIKKIRTAQRAKKLERGRPTAMLEAALAAGVITTDDVELMAKAEAARDDAVQVDSFTEAEYLATAAGGGWGDGQGMADFDLA